jgi:hypothetical protein
VNLIGASVPEHELSNVLITHRKEENIWGGRPSILLSEGLFHVRDSSADDFSLAGEHEEFLSVVVVGPVATSKRLTILGLSRRERAPDQTV